MGQIEGKEGIIVFMENIYVIPYQTYLQQRDEEDEKKAQLPAF